MYPEDDQFNQFLLLAIQQSMQSKPKVDKELAGAYNMVELMSAFKDVKAAIGCPIKAAYHCPTFVQFLDKNEHKALKTFKKEQEEDDSDSYSNS